MLKGVTEHTEDPPIELWLTYSGRFVIRFYNDREYLYGCWSVDLIDWIRSGQTRTIDVAGIATVSASE